MDRTRLHFTKIRDREIQGFIKEWNKNTNEVIELPDFGSDDFGSSWDKTKKVSQKEMRFFLEDFLKAFLSNRDRFRIVGADIMNGFIINIANFDVLVKTCQDIWDNPKNYYKLEEYEDDYYSFLKYLWVEGSFFGKEGVKLHDLVKKGTEDDVKVEEKIKFIKENYE